MQVLQAKLACNFNLKVIEVERCINAAVCVRVVCSCWVMGRYGRQDVLCVSMLHSAFAMCV